MITIISPHPDDEIIGTGSLLQKEIIDRVIYIDASEDRLARAKVLGEDMGFEVEKMDFYLLGSYLHCVKTENLTRTSKNKKIVLVPDSSDNHPLHQAVNSIAKMSGCRLGYYSTDMTASYIRELSVEARTHKRAMLNKYYPDQKDLWKYEHKYFLFEGIVQDVDSITSITL